MDPDILEPSDEKETVPEALPVYSATSQQSVNIAASVPVPLSSPLVTSVENATLSANSSTPSKLSRSPSSTSLRGERTQTPKSHPKTSKQNANLLQNSTPTLKYRRSSSNLNPASEAIAMRSSPPYMESSETLPLTAETVARDYFEKELDLHGSNKSQTLVIVHDACYGHRFSRPRTSKAALGTIVERPERIRATLLGVATAYVRLGGRHMDGRYAPHPNPGRSASDSLPFSVRKSSRSIDLNHPCVTHVHGAKWMEELQIMCDSAESKLALNGRELARPIGYGKDESGNVLPKLHEGDLYLCSESLHALQGCLGGMCDAVDAIFAPGDTKRAFVCIRPPGHHCSSNFPSGFCWLNNVHVGISYAAMNHDLTHAAIIDFDLHHGDGSQTITWDHNRKAQNLPKNAASHKKTPIGYYSLHDINSYPCEWGDEDKVRNASLCIENAHGQSIWNVHLGSWRNLEEFWKLYENRYLTLLEKTRFFLRHHSKRLRESGVQPRAAIFLSAGFDASEWEGVGMQRHNVNVPTEFYARFTSDIVKMAEEEDLGVSGRIISVLEGGYSDRALTSGVLSHVCGLVDESSTDVYFTTGEGLRLSMPSLEANGTFSAMQESRSYVEPHESSWWSLESLEKLEACISGRTPSITKAKDKPPGHYSSPTQASTARMTDQARERRSLSAQLEARLMLEPTSEPPPDVDWVVASCELSKLLIPNDRQTLSCRHEELNAEATKARKERQSLLSLPGQTAAESMQLRDRKVKAPSGAVTAVKTVSRGGNRRTTIAAVSELPNPNNHQLESGGVPSERPRRRSSTASSMVSSFQDIKLTDANETATNVNVKNDISSFESTRSTKAPVVKKPRGSTTKTQPKPKLNSEVATAAPLNSLKNASSSGAVISAPGSRHDGSRSRRASGASNKSQDDLENLTSQMKKVSIKLKVSNEEDQSVKQRTVKEELQKKARQPRKPPVPKLTKSKSTTKAIPPANDTQMMQRSYDQLNQLPAIAPKQPVYSVAEANTALSTNNVSELTSEPTEASPAVVSEHSSRPDASIICQIERPTEPSSTLRASEPPEISSNPSTHQDVGANVDMTNTSNGLPAHDIMMPHTAYDVSRPTEAQPKPFIAEQVAQSLDYKLTDQPRASTRPWTPTKYTKKDLPTFTSSSPIPFAAPSAPISTITNSNSQFNGKQEVDKKGPMNVWDIPETPMR